MAPVAGPAEARAADTRPPPRFLLVGSWPPSAAHQMLGVVRLLTFTRSPCENSETGPCPRRWLFSPRKAGPVCVACLQRVRVEAAVVSSTHACRF